MADELDVDAMLEAPYQKEVSIIFNCVISVYNVTSKWHDTFRAISISDTRTYIYLSL